MCYEELSSLGEHISDVERTLFGGGGGLKMGFASGISGGGGDVKNCCKDRFCTKNAGSRAWLHECHLHLMWIVWAFHRTFSQKSYIRTQGMCMHTEGLLPCRENCDIASDPARLIGSHCALVNNVSTSGRQCKTVWWLRSRPVQLAVQGRSQLVAGAQWAMAAGWVGIPVGYEVHAALQAQRGHAAWTDGRKWLKKI